METWHCMLHVRYYRKKHQSGGASQRTLLVSICGTSQNVGHTYACVHTFDCILQVVIKNVPGKEKLTLQNSICTAYKNSESSVNNCAWLRGANCK